MIGFRPSEWGVLAPSLIKVSLQALANLNERLIVGRASPGRIGRDGARYIRSMLLCHGYNVQQNADFVALTD
jgi:hypothetical protein